MRKNKLYVTDIGKSINLMHYVSVDMGMFRVESVSHSLLDDHGADINETELTFFINDKGCKNRGFEELYDKLHGDGSFLEFKINLYSRIEDAVAKEIIKEYPGTKVNY